MAILAWDQVGVRFFETGVDKGVFYPKIGSGVAWNGLISVKENISGGEQSAIYFDGNKLMDIIAGEDYRATIDAFSAPEEFLICAGNKTLANGLVVTQQPRISFGFSYRTLKGNDLKATSYGYKIHLVYNAKASPTERQNSTLSESADPTTLSWTVDSVPPTNATFKPAAHLVIDSTLANATKLATLENLLYGTSGVNAALPTQAVVISTLT